MEKLIKYLNEYDGTPTEWKQIGDKIYFDGLGGNSELHELIIISKYYGFIKWLVENDKIDISKLGKKSDMGFGDKYTREESLLMILAISKNPIKELISYLK